MTPTDESKSTNIREYTEHNRVALERNRYDPEVDRCDTPESMGHDRWVVLALNEGGYNSTRVDLLDLLAFVKQEMPEVWDSIR